MGLVALTWIRIYKPLLAENFPQNPRNRQGAVHLGFAKDAFLRISSVSHHDLRVGTCLSRTTGAALDKALRRAAETVINMPGRFIKYPNSDRQVLLFPVRGATTKSRPMDVRLDNEYLSSFGMMRVPIHLWTAIQRFATWIEPAILAEWKRVTRKYAERQGRILVESDLSAAMAWSDPLRDVRVPRERAEQLLAAGNLYCVWSGKRLNAGNLDIDHCFPWTVWPCGDLWNLMPAHRKDQSAREARSAAGRPAAANRAGTDPRLVERGVPRASGPSAGAALRTRSVGEPARRRCGRGGPRQLLLRPEPAASAVEAEPAGAGMERPAPICDARIGRCSSCRLASETARCSSPATLTNLLQRLQFQVYPRLSCCGLDSCIADPPQSGERVQDTRPR